MDSRHKLASFKKEVSPLLELVTNDIYLESIWLGNMSMLEDIAAKYILSNITKATPAEALRNIIEHVKDEQRHARILEEMRPVTIYPELKYYLIEEEWKKIGQEFILGFFNTPLLREANHRHAAYVHGAQTIERFPFRIYSLYLSMSKLEIVKAELPGIMEDENEHIELGKQMYAKLDASERMSLSKLYRLEEELCLMMLKRMNLALRQILNLYGPEFNCDLEERISKDGQLEVAWNYALSCGENCFSPPRAQHLKDANTLQRMVFRKNSEFRDLEKSLSALVNDYIVKAKVAGVSESIILNRFDNHYKKMIYNTNNVPLSYAYFRILEDLPSNAISDESVGVESTLWAELNSEFSRVNQNENGLRFSRA